MDTHIVEDDPKGFYVNCIKSLGQVNEHSVEVHLLVDTLLLNLSHGKHHVRRAAAGMKATLDFRQAALGNVTDEPVEDDNEDWDY